MPLGAAGFHGAIVREATGLPGSTRPPPPNPDPPMINRLIEWSLRNRFLVVCGALALVAWGVRSLYHTPVDAIPDLSENQVIVVADWPGRSPREVEDQVTYPAVGQPPGPGRRENRPGLVDVRLHVHHRDLRGQGGQLLRPNPRAGAAQLPRRSPAARGGAQAWPRRQRAGLGLSVLPGGGSRPLAQRRLRPLAVARACRIGSSATSSTP